MPADFIVLSGDDALTLPLMAVGGRGIISVASNEIPAEMVQMVEAAERNDFAAARAIHARILPLMQINFVESNPRPVKAAMAAMGLLEEMYRLPMVVADAPESKEKIIKPCSRRSACSRRALVVAMSSSSSARDLKPTSPTRRAGASADRDTARAVFARLREALSSGRCAPPSPTRRARSAGASTRG